MNRIERKLYELISTISEKGNPALDKEINYKAKDGTQKKIVARAALRLPQDHPAHKEAEKIVKQTQAAEPKQKSAEKPTEKKPAQKPAEKKPTAQPAGQPAQKAEPVKISAADFRTDAEKNAEKGPKPGVDMGKSFDKMKTQRPGADDTKLKSLMPGVDTSKTTLDQSPMARQQLSLKMDELAKLVDAAATKEEKDSIDACVVTIPGTSLFCGDDLDIPRVEMPQFKGKARPGSDADKLPKNKDNEVDGEAFFQKFLKDSNIKVNSGEDGKGVEVPPDRMKATQRDMQASKILGMMKGLEEDPENPNLTAPIMVSSDGYILDGHHRWAAMVAYNAKNPDKPIPLKATIIDKPIKELVPIANKFADGMGIEKKSVGKPKEPQKQPTAEKKNPSLVELLTVKN